MSNVECQVNKVILSLSLSFIVEDLVQGVRKQCRYGSSWAGTLGAFQPRAPGKPPDAIKGWEAGVGGKVREGRR